MNTKSISRQRFTAHLAASGLEGEFIPSFVRSMRICFATDPQMNTLKANRQIRSLGWNNVNLDDRTLQLAFAFFKAEGMAIGLTN